MVLLFLRCDLRSTSLGERVGVNDEKRDPADTASGGCKAPGTVAQTLGEKVGGTVSAAIFIAPGCSIDIHGGGNHGHPQREQTAGIMARLSPIVDAHRVLHVDGEKMSRCLWAQLLHT